MVPAIIETLVVGMNPSPSVVVLRPYVKDQDKVRLLPIWIGPAEAMSIGMALEGATFKRPTPHDLAIGMLTAIGATLDRVEINRVEGGTFYASVVLKKGDGELAMIDARPSDALALAIRAKVSIFVSDEIFEKATLPDFFSVGQKPSTEQIEKQVSEFKDFVEGVSPEDFAV